MYRTEWSNEGAKQTYVQWLEMNLYHLRKSASPASAPSAYRYRTVGDWSATHGIDLTPEHMVGFEVARELAPAPVPTPPAGPYMRVSRRKGGCFCEFYRCGSVA